MRNESETIFEQFLSYHGVPYEAIAVADSPRPDYAVGRGTEWGPVLFEVKELREDDAFEPGGSGLSHRKIGAHIHAKINDSKRQIQFGARQGIPSILLIYNRLDPVFHLFGTEDQDFLAAMHGDWTAIVDSSSGGILAAGHDKSRAFQERRNTSFTALAHLAPVRGLMTVRLFPNPHAQVPLPPALPLYFEVVTGYEQPKFL